MAGTSDDDFFQNLIRANMQAGGARINTQGQTSPTALHIPLKTYMLRPH